MITWNTFHMCHVKIKSKYGEMIKNMYVNRSMNTKYSSVTANIQSLEKNTQKNDAYKKILTWAPQYINTKGSMSRFCFTLILLVLFLVVSGVGDGSNSVVYWWWSWWG